MREHVAERIAERGPAAVADMHGTDRVGGDELHLDLLACAEIGATERGALRTDLVEDVVRRGFGEIEVDESRTGDLDAVERGIGGDMGGDRLGDGARSGMGELCGAQRGRG